MRRPGRGVGAAAAIGCALALTWTVWPQAMPHLTTAGRPAGTPAGGAPTSGPAAPPTSGAPAKPASLDDAAGALFDGTPDKLGDHFCSGAVIDSPSGNLVITAAHCVQAGDGSPVRTGMQFVPGYHDGIAPYGVWTVTSGVVDPRWADGADPDRDVAFLTVQRAGGGSVEALTGGYKLVTDPGFVADVHAIGYPDTSDAPVIRTGTTSRWSPTQLELDAPGLYDGTSGGPWVRNGDEVVGVTGGYEQGGLTPDVSYAAYLDGDVRALLQRTES
ncbi:trypsin-like serine peptidase [Pseudonocardia acidicola]|uniref:Trypsin-like serine protease n=1 Tax=Pseudonocardia acidicola TaxID=2724939 RepID=A0ABX1SKB6_9PSEU|nr:serine protease [Pseudonocardia acidicola]NMI00715.1 trypsin-like serine protease [Pseudonocardia acidicola]